MNEMTAALLHAENKVTSLRGRMAREAHSISENMARLARRLESDPKFVPNSLGEGQSLGDINRMSIELVGAIEHLGMLKSLSEMIK